MLTALRELKRAGVSRVWIGGGFVTDDERPADFDGCYPVVEVDPLNLKSSALASGNKEVMKKNYGGELYPTFDMIDFLRFFERDRDGRSVGVVEIDLTTLP